MPRTTRCMCLLVLPRSISNNTTHVRRYYHHHHLDITTSIITTGWPIRWMDQAYRRAISLNSDNPLAYKGLLELLTTIEKWQEVIACIDTMLPLVPYVSHQPTCTRYNMCLIVERQSNVLTELAMPRLLSTNASKLHRWRSSIAGSRVPSVGKLLRLSFRSTAAATPTTPTTPTTPSL
jgi:hypothetical protein